MRDALSDGHASCFAPDAQPFLTITALHKQALEAMENVREAVEQVRRQRRDRRDDAPRPPARQSRRSSSSTSASRSSTESSAILHRQVTAVHKPTLHAIIRTLNKGLFSLLCGVGARRGRPGASSTSDSDILDVRSFGATGDGVSARYPRSCSGPWMPVPAGEARISSRRDLSQRGLVHTGNHVVLEVAGGDADGTDARLSAKKPNRIPVLRERGA